MLTRHPSNTKTHVEKDEINIIETITAAKNMSTDTSTSIIEERVKAAAKLEGISLTKNKKTTNNTFNGTTNVSINNVDRLSKESGIGSSVGSSFDEKDDEIDYFNNESSSFPSQYITNTSIPIENTKILPRVNQSLDDLDDTTIKLINDNKKSLGIITEEEESYNNSNSEITTESSTFNDTESSSGGEPDSPSLVNNLSVPVNNSSKIELERRKNNSFKRKNSGRSIFSVLSSSSYRSSSSSSLQRGSLSDPEDNSPNRHRDTMPGSPSKSGRSGFSSLSIRRRRSKPTLSLAITDSNIKNKISSGLSTSRPGSPENADNLSKAGKILGLTISEDKILLDNKNRLTTKRSRDFNTTISSDERILSSSSTKSSTKSSPNKNSPNKSSPNKNSPNKSSPNKVNKVSGYNDNRPILNRSSKANKVLGIDNADLESLMTVASIKNDDIIYKGFLTKHTSTNFVLSKSWKRRYFILAKNTIYCFKSSDDASQLLEQFELNAESVVCVSDAFSGKSWVLQVGKPNQKSWYIQAENVEDMKVWLTELKSTVVKCNNTPEILPQPNSTSPYDNNNKEEDDDDDEDDYDDDDKINAMHQRTISSPSRLLVDPPMSLMSSVNPSVKSSSSSDDNSIDQYSLPPPPRTFVMTSLPPPPRPRSAPSSPSCPPSPTSLSLPQRSMSPNHHIPSDAEELSNDPINNSNLEIIPRSSSPVETLSPPRARFGSSIHSHQHNGSISSTYSTNSTTSSKQRSSFINGPLSINTTSIQQSSSRQSPITPSAINYSPKKLSRNSSLSSHRESIPIMMPSWGLTTASNSALNSVDSLSPPRFFYNGQQIPINLSPEFYTHSPNPPKPPEGPKPPAKNNSAFDRRLTRSPPPNIPLPQPPPRPTNTLTSASRSHTMPIPASSRPISPPVSSHPMPPPIPPPRRPSTDGRMGGKGKNTAIANLPIPSQSTKPVTLSSQGKSSQHERAMTLPVNLPSCTPSDTKLPSRPKSPPPSRKNITSMVYSSNQPRFQTMSIHFPSTSLPPPTRPPNVPLPPVPTQSSLPFSVDKDITNNRIQNITLPSTATINQTEFPDDDDLDPDYADELAASRIHSQKMKNTSINSDNNYSSTNYHQQLSASGLAFVMVEETLGDGKLVLDLQDVGKNHPHLIKSKTPSYSNIYDLTQNDKEKGNKNILSIH